MQFLISLIVGISAGTWVYSRFMRTTGGNAKSAITMAVVSGIGAFIIIYMLALTFLKS